MVLVGHREPEVLADVSLFVLFIFSLTPVDSAKMTF